MLLIYLIVNYSYREYGVPLHIFFENLTRGISHLNCPDNRVVQASRWKALGSLVHIPEQANICISLISVSHSSAKPIQMKPNMTFIQSNWYKEIELIFMAAVSMTTGQFIDFFSILYCCSLVILFSIEATITDFPSSSTNIRGHIY